jgi:hypothetical protein
MSQVVSPIMLTSGELSIDKDLTISGPGADVLTVRRDDGAKEFRIFTIASSVVNISGLIITKGVTRAGGGGILNNSTLTISNSWISGNRTNVGGSAGDGGGILNNGTLMISDSGISGNFTGQGAAAYRGGDGGSGGGIYNGGLLTISNSSITGNGTGNGGYGNSSNSSGRGGDGGSGGGIYNGGPLTISNSTISSNRTGNGGGNQGDGGSGGGGKGGGIYNGGPLTISNSTITSNRTGSSGGNQGDGGSGGGILNTDTLTLKNTIIAGNAVELGRDGKDISGRVDPASSFNLIGVGGSGGLTNGVNHNQVGVADPGLGPLAINGGPTPTHALLTGSPALDAGSNAFITNPPFSGPPFTDQRGTGFDRIADGPHADTAATVDIGAFEGQQVSIEDITDKTMSEDDWLQFTFNVGGPDSITSVIATSSNIALVPNDSNYIVVNGSGPFCSLLITPARDQFGMSTITVTVNGKNIQSTDTFVLTVNPVADTPSVTSATTTENTQTTNGLVISRNPADGAEVTHFKITNIQNGTLFKSDGTTQINNTDFITFAEGQAGLKFTPANNLFSPATEFSFNVQAAMSNSDTGVGGQIARATITVAGVGCNETRVVTNSNDSGDGSLRDAISYACAGSTITFDMGRVTSPITLTSGPLYIAKDLEISGPGANVLTIHPSGQFRIFTITSVTVTISDLTVTEGRASEGSDGGGILNTGKLTIRNSTISNNSTGLPTSYWNTSGGKGGGILNSGTLAIINSTISSNETSGGGSGRSSGGPGHEHGGVGGDGGDGGGICNTGRLTIINSTISGNRTGSGGGGESFASAGGVGGRGGHGGGIYNAGSGNMLTIINSTISDNKTGSGGMGGCYQCGFNSGRDGSGGSGGGIVGSGVTLTNTIIAGNTVASGGQDPNISGTAEPASSFNLIGIGGSGGLTNGVNGNQVGVANPGLGPLVNNGGPTMTHALLPGSPAIDAGSNAFITNPPFIGPPFTDQRGGGFDRIVNTTVDIGAFESRGFTIAASENAQSTLILSAFDSPLVATVLTTFGEPVAGLVVSFTAPASGASGTFPGNTTAVTATTNDQGVATSPTFTANGTAGGPYNVVASIGTGLPTATFSLTNLIPKASTATGVTASGNQSVPNQAVTFTATVTSVGGTPTGTVQFKDNGANLGGPQTLDGSGVATLTIASLTVGMHTITADYSGDANSLASTGTLADGQQVGSIIRFESATYDTTESSLVSIITVERAGNTAEAVSVDYATPDDSAATPTILPCSTPGLVSARCDFTTSSGTLKFAAGETSKTFQVLISQDNYVEGAESLTLTLSNSSSNAFLESPSTATLTIADDVSEPAEDPMDDSRNFVRQHYHDFLNREPEPNDVAGLNFWTKEMGDYWANPEYHDLKCQNVSGAFFLSIEFQESGYYVYRMHKAAFGDLDPPAVPVPLRYLSFIRDTQEVRAGIILGQTDWRAQLDRNKQAYALEFVQRPEFRRRHPSLTAPAAFVNLLNANAGDVLTSSERETLIRQLSINLIDPSLRAEVLMKVAESAALKREEFNRAFVLMQYFGYLRRNPDAAPEKGLNFEGYNFWLQKLNSVDGNFVKAEMVKAFIKSSEYRQRFGTP